MNYASLSGRLDDLPNIIAGPILRRVTKNEICIWIATRKDCLGGIKIMNGDGGSFVINRPADQHLHRLGEKLWAGCIVCIDLHLDPGTIYTYDLNLQFKNGNQWSNEVGLNSGGVLSTSDYPDFNVNLPGYNFPSFIVPKDHVKEVNILHGSCRKPHGEGMDAMRGVYKALRVNGASEKERPQILCLTGDQIYADDVASGMLFMIRDAQDTLMNVQQILPITSVVKHFQFKRREVDAQMQPLPYTETLGIANYSGDDLKEKEYFEATWLRGKTLYTDFPGLDTPESPELYYRIVSTTGELPEPELQTTSDSLAFSVKTGRRWPFMNLCAGFTVDKELGGSHLISFNEYAMMYLFVFSDVLWPSVNPSIEDVFGDPIPEDVPKEAIGSFGNEIKALNKFKEGLKEVRKLLANISTYMILDDHEITDDAFINSDWVSRVFGTPYHSRFGRPTGEFVVSNALAAYVIFQCEGNSPVEFSSLATSVATHWGAILSQAQNSISSRLKANEAFTRVFTLRKETKEGSVAEQQEYIPGTTQGVLPFPGPVYSRSIVQWKDMSEETIAPEITLSFSLRFEDYTLLFLDTRCTRSYYIEYTEYDYLEKILTVQTTKNAPMLVSQERMTEIFDQELMDGVLDEEIPDYTLILVSPSPVLGHEVVEALVDGILIPNGKTTPQRQIDTFEIRDFEAWIYHRKTFEKLIQKLNTFRRVVILSGDVHYSFGIEQSYWRKVGETTKGTKIVQFVASSFKNETSLTKGAEKLPSFHTNHYVWEQGGPVQVSSISLDDFVKAIVSIYNAVNGNLPDVTATATGVISGGLPPITYSGNLQTPVVFDGLVYVDLSKSGLMNYLEDAIKHWKERFSLEYLQKELAEILKDVQDYIALAKTLYDLGQMDAVVYQYIFAKWDELYADLSMYREIGEAVDYYITPVNEMNPEYTNGHVVFGEFEPDTDPFILHVNNVNFIMNKWSERMYNFSPDTNVNNEWISFKNDYQGTNYSWIHDVNGPLEVLNTPAITFFSKHYTKIYKSIRYLVENLSSVHGAIRLFNKFWSWLQEPVDWIPTQIFTNLPLALIYTFESNTPVPTVVYSRKNLKDEKSTGKLINGRIVKALSVQQKAQLRESFDCKSLLFIPPLFKKPNSFLEFSKHSHILTYLDEVVAEYYNVSPFPVNIVPRFLSFVSSPEFTSSLEDPVFRNTLRNRLINAQILDSVLFWDLLFDAGNYRMGLFDAPEMTFVEGPPQQEFSQFGVGMHQNENEKFSEVLGRNAFGQVKFLEHHPVDAPAELFVEQYLWFRPSESNLASLRNFLLMEENNFSEFIGFVPYGYFKTSLSLKEHHKPKAPGWGEN